MTTLDPDFAARDARRAAMFARITKAEPVLGAVGLGFVAAILRAIAGDNPRGQLAQIWRLAGVPVLSITVFLMLWGTFARWCKPRLGPSPAPLRSGPRRSACIRMPLKKPRRKPSSTLASTNATPE